MSRYPRPCNRLPGDLLRRGIVRCQRAASLAGNGTATLIARLSGNQPRNTEVEQHRTAIVPDDHVEGFRSR